MMYAFSVFRPVYLLGIALAGAFGAGACFQSDFVLYGPRCNVGKSDCEDVIGDRGQPRTCYGPVTGLGYCTQLCETAEDCGTEPESKLRCLERIVDKGTKILCVLVCESESDCPDSMDCIPDPEGDEDLKLCVPQSS